jgi:hypothetical protein
MWYNAEMDTSLSQYRPSQVAMAWGNYIVCITRRRMSHSNLTAIQFPQPWQQYTPGVGNLFMLEGRINLAVIK